jgi:hypothetical protein
MNNRTTATTARTSEPVATAGGTCPTEARQHFYSKYETALSTWTAAKRRYRALMMQGRSRDASAYLPQVRAANNAVMAMEPRDVD